ncbi:MAG: Rrf2 family transcriptional regulator [Sedimentisphaerales bacterium]|nr:Rrf2 family transcriptional regulator [Sedimentisphaerales bacterium]
MALKINQDFGMAISAINFLKDKNTSQYIQASEIAKHLQFSVGYLQKVIQMLNKHGLLECKRGRIGGVRLCANVITLLDLWNITCGESELADPSLTILKKPLKDFFDSMSKIVVYKKTRK